LSEITYAYRIEDHNEYFLCKLLGSRNRASHMHQEPIYRPPVPVIKDQ